ncbi:hypothetical protein EMMF5_004562 [Cystobasidiomycetes sp. EMM_F5]
MTAKVDVSAMALYNLNRAHKELLRLQDKEVWESKDTAAFHSMHYLGDQAIESAAIALDIRRDTVCLDVGSGFCATDRYLYEHFGTQVVGVELQQDIHDIAEIINHKTRMAKSVRSVHSDILSVTITEAPVDYVVSFLCILHIKDRVALFKKLFSLIKPGGAIYIEDYYARTALSPSTSTTLKTVVSCPHLPDRQKYLCDVEEAGFNVVSFTDVSETWATFVHNRAVTYRQQENAEPLLQDFYDTIDLQFAGGEVGGALK